MIASSRVHSPSRARLSQRIAQGLAAVHRMLEDVILPSRGGHPALSFREIDRF